MTTQHLPSTVWNLQYLRERTLDLISLQESATKKAFRNGNNCISSQMAECWHVVRAREKT